MGTQKERFKGSAEEYLKFGVGCLPLEGFKFHYHPMPMLYLAMGIKSEFRILDRLIVEDESGDLIDKMNISRIRDLRHVKEIIS